jgi:hypothetical protein
VELKLKIMKKLIIALLISVSCFTACTTVDTADVSRITYFPVFTVSGASTVFVKKGATYVEPGAVAKAGTTIVPTVTTSVGNYTGTSPMNTSIPDQYLVSYSATNVDGFVGSASREVWVYNTGDLVNSIEGLYTSTVVRNGLSGAQYTDMKYILIWKNANGTYEMTDGLGGYYNYGRGYGVGYAARPVTITANSIATNDFSVPNFSVGAFGGVAKMSGISVDAAAKTITYTTTWDAGYTFVVTLKQVQP